MRSQHVWRAYALLATLWVATPGAAQFSAPAAKLTETLRISGADEDLTRIGPVFVAPDGRIGFTQPMDFRVLIYSPSGKRIAAFGRRGGGPGEFQALGSTGWMGDSVWAYDNTSRQVSVFSAAGVHARTATYVSVTVPPTFTTLPASRTANFRMSVATAGGAFIASRSASSAESPPTVFARVTADGQVDRVLIQHPQDAAAISIPTGRGTTYTSIPFINEYNDFVAPDGSRLGYFHFDRSVKPQVQLLVVSSNGDSLLRRTYPFTPVQVTQSEKDSVLAERVKGMQGPSTVYSGNGVVTQNVTRTMPQAEIDAYTGALKAGFPTVHAPITAARLGLDNTIWVQLREARGGVQWVMLNERGDPEFRITLPANTRIVQASRSTLWTVQTDADDLQSIVRFQIDRCVGASPSQCASPSP